MSNTREAIFDKNQDALFFNDDSEKTINSEDN
jgi:hypothetical protein